jgi:transitional endoplasmic reticulum ATPase
VTTPKEHEEAVSTTVQIRKKTGGGFADVAGMQTLKDELTKRVIWVLKDKEKAEKYRLTPPNGMILYGPPGCGKTYFAEKFAEEAQFNFTMVSGSDLGSTYMHGTQGKIANLLKEAEQRAPVILCFDEFDSFVPSRGSSDANQRGEEVNEFLAQLNNCSKRGIFVIGTTNRIELIDPAILRKGRMDLHVEIPAPDAETRASIFQLHLRERPVAEDVNAQELAGLTENYAAADIAFIVNEAAMMAALADDLIRQEHLVNSIKCNKSSLGEVCVRRKIGY